MPPVQPKAPARSSGSRLLRAARPDARVLQLRVLSVLVQLTDDVWVGNSADEKGSDLKGWAALNVAHDLRPTRGWPDVEYAHVGLVDGPGNPPEAYCAAVMALAALIAKGRRVMVCCHTGSRSVAVVAMYLHSVNGLGWDHNMELLKERAAGDLPEPHRAHREACECLTFVVGSSAERRPWSRST